MSNDANEICFSGLGVTSAIGQGKDPFISSLLAGRHAFDVMQRPGRQIPSQTGKSSKDVPVETAFLGAEIGTLRVPDSIDKKILRTLSFSAQVALATLDEAWQEAKLGDVDPHRIGMIVGGSNFQQRELVLNHNKYQHKPHFLRPTYAMGFMDSDLCGVCTEQFNIRGPAYTLGGASASGQVAVIQAINAVASGQVDVCVAMGALMDLSYWECQSFRSLGAMGSTRFQSQPDLACRPYDKDRDGFIFGESCGVLVIENQKSAQARGLTPYASAIGWSFAMDGNRNPNPSFDGEVRAIKQSLEQAGMSAADIDYVNPHGTGSNIGDEIELEAIQHCGLNQALINTTKSVTGHGLSAAGATEIIATLLQMNASQVHPMRNVENPISSAFEWVGPEAKQHTFRNALKMSMGFGGVSSALCLRNLR